MEIKDKLNIADFKEMQAMEKQYYNSDYIADYKDAFDWYENFSFTTMAIEDQGKIIGFLDLFPVKESIFYSLKKGMYNDKNLKTEDIVDIGKIKDMMDIKKIKDVQYDLFLCCIVIDKAYRKTDAVKLLLKTYMNFYQSFSTQGISFDEVITDNVTIEGERFSEKLGFKKLLKSDHGSVVYGHKFKDLCEIVNNL